MAVVWLAARRFYPASHHLLIAYCGNSGVGNCPILGILDITL